MNASMPVPCPLWAEKLATTHPADLSPAERAALNAHVLACPACAAVGHHACESCATCLDEVTVEQVVAAVERLVPDERAVPA